MRYEFDVTKAISRMRGEGMVNVTKHPIRFQSSEDDGVTYEVPPSGVVLDALFEEELAGEHPSGAMLVRAKIMPAPGAEEKLAQIEREHPGKLIIGSFIAAQTFPGRVAALISATGFERVPADQKRMRDDKFTVF